jgi:hypothetical protein
VIVVVIVAVDVAGAVAAASVAVFEMFAHRRALQSSTAVCGVPLVELALPLGAAEAGTAGEAGTLSSRIEVLMPSHHLPTPSHPTPFQRTPEPKTHFRISRLIGNMGTCHRRGQHGNMDSLYGNMS